MFSQIKLQVIRTDDRARNWLLPAKVYHYMYKGYMYVWRSDQRKVGHAQAGEWCLQEGRSHRLISSCVRLNQWFIHSGDIVTYKYHSGSFFTSNALDGGKVNTYKRVVCDVAKLFYVNSPLSSYAYGSREYQEQLCLAVMNSGGNTLRGLRGRLCFSTQPRLWALFNIFERNYCWRIWQDWTCDGRL